VTYTPAGDRYDTMTYRRAGRSGLLLPAISLGLWHNFGDGRPLERQRDITRRAFDDPIQLPNPVTRLPDYPIT